MGLEVKSSHRYTAFAWPHGFHSPCLRHYWELLFAKQETPGAVYQSPEFFDYLKETGGKNRLDVIAVKDRANDAIVGVVPVQKASTQLPFFLGERTLARSRVKSLAVLGSEPMMPQDPDALDSLFALMSEHYPESQVVDMDAVPADGYLWKYLNASPVIKQCYDLHVLHGFRDCHSVDIPPSIGEYYHRLTKKRRYNLLRQEKLLQGQTGQPLTLVVVEDERNISELFAAIEHLGAEGEDDAVLEQRKYIALARHGFLCCFVLKAGARIVGLTLGTKSKKILRIHRFFYDKSLERFSPGTTLWQVVLRHLIQEARFINVDMGYGTPAYRYRATNTIIQKGKVLLFRRSLANRARVFAHSSYSSAVNLLKARREAVRAE